MKKMNNIYADHSATTPLLSEALEAMMPYLQEDYGNPSSLHGRGVMARRAVEEARARVAECIGAYADEIYFTSGGTESDNWALFGTVMDMRKKDCHLVVSSIEHHAVLNSCKALKGEGVEVTCIPVTVDGRVEVSELMKALRQETRLVSIMFANNEIGTIQKIGELASVAHMNGTLFHTDAVQAVGHVKVDVKELGVDMLSASAHKFNGPKGVGFLYVKRGIVISPFHCGGHQEGGMRAGTENVAGIVGMAAALDFHTRNLVVNERRLSSLAELLIGMIAEECQNAVFNGDRKQCLPGHISVSFPGCDGEALLHMLDLKGICVSTGAACNSRTTEISYVLKAIGLDERTAKGTLRISLGYENSEEEIRRIASTLAGVVKKV